MTTVETRTFSVPTRDEVSTTNQSIFDSLQKGLGFVPNLYAYFGKNETALSDYLTLQNRKSTLRPKEREVINLVTSSQHTQFWVKCTVLQKSRFWKYGVARRLSTKS